jgi:hypothetical protein
MKRLVSSFCFVLICTLGTASALAQVKQKTVKPKPDLTGNWMLDTAKSNVGRSATSDQPIKIAHHDPEFRITRMVESNGRVAGQDFVYYTDGRGETNRMVMSLRPHSYLYPERDDKVAIRSKTTWTGNKLVTRSRSPARGVIGGQLLEFEIIDEWKLSPDGKTFTLTSRTVSRQDGSGAIFVPANRPDMKRVYNRLPD